MTVRVHHKYPLVDNRYMDQIASMLRRYPSQRKVAQKLLEYGIRVSNGVAYCGDIEQTDAGIARACDVDRRVVRTTLEHISATPELDCIFSKLRPMLSMVDMAEQINCSAIVIIPTDARVPGIIADVTTVLYNSGITLRQAMVSDEGDREHSTLQIVVDGKLQENVIMMIKSCRGVDSVLIK
ncbi:ACT domain-containing protein [methanogenic archaeon mixed culture ISO4-G1]|nr:ACT domain-containing protein [methanogenic archaeon mixed culture ISO4-G1]